MIQSGTYHRKLLMITGTLLQVASTEQAGNVIWYELSDDVWILSMAKQQFGKPYVWNVKGPSGFYCSRVMQYV
ncbi:hypothetical protein ACFQAV_06090 [Companilactobacillus huachuanensis]|uniref:Uncharacterized protein n=1 Tax=Companilactobacillus huachuanensis TaxID=2559914 RepID=A0ABW1RKL8_9LACO|nr:NlpC/P60 family protein [Companilactobacillus huachuanensis]